jgi:xanthine permease XanP
MEAMGSEAYRKPVGIQYSVEERPPMWQGLLLIGQYVLIVVGSLVIPALVVRESGCSQTEAGQLVAACLLTMGIGSILQCHPFIGSGYLCPAICGAEFVAASILAVSHGGYAMLSGMLLLVGVFQAAISPVVSRLRPFFPVEVAGVVIMMTGITLIKYCVPGFLGIVDGKIFANGPGMAVAFLSLAAMIVPSVWGNGFIRQNAVLLGIAFGVFAAYLGGFVTRETIGIAGAGPIMAVPWPGWSGWAWNASMVTPFLVAGVCCVLGTIGNVTACQKGNSDAWVRPDMKVLGKGVLAQGLTNVLAGAMGSAGQSSSAVSVGVSMATGVTSRFIGLGVGISCIVLSFFPGVLAWYTLLPRPVLDAAIVMGVCYIMLVGLQMVSSRMLNVRKTLMVGISIIAGLCVDIVPGVSDHLNPTLRPLFSSSLTTSTVVAVVLNLIFRLGVRQNASMDLALDEEYRTRIHRFLGERGAAWGMRRQIVERAGYAIEEYLEGASGLNSNAAAYHFRADFDEFHLNIEISYQGKMLDLSGQRPTHPELLEDDAAVTRLAGYLVRHYADRVSCAQKGDTAYARLTFNQ